MQDGEGENIRLDSGSGVKGMTTFGGVDYGLYNVSRRLLF